MVINGASTDKSDILTIISSCDISIRNITINNGATGADGCTIIVINDKLSIDLHGSLLVDDSLYGAHSGTRKRHWVMHLMQLDQLQLNLMVY